MPKRLKSCRSIAPPSLKKERRSLRASKLLDSQETRLRQESLSLQEASIATGASVSRLRELASKGRVLAVVADNELRLPAWQLRMSEISPVVPGARELADAFPGHLASLHDWLIHPDPEAGITPIDLLEKGEMDTVLALAKTIGAAGQ